MEGIDSNQTWTWWWTGDEVQDDLRGSRTWVFSILASCTVGLSGIVPLIIVPDVKSKGGLLQVLLGFAVGGLLGDVFLHLLPEAWNAVHRDQSSCSCSSFLALGVWVLLGLFTFVAIEMMIVWGRTDDKPEEKDVCEGDKQASLDANQNETAKFCTEKRDHLDSSSLSERHKQLSEKPVSTKALPVEKANPKHITGYLNLVANAVDNFAHGLAVAASFIVGTKMGVLTTAAILIHEIPHEVGDFAILLRSGFNRWEAAKAQLSTATIGVAGAIFALSANSLEEVGRSTAWILPFTAGGFLNIALVNILPELMREDQPWESMKQVLAVCTGIAVMASVSFLT